MTITEIAAQLVALAARAGLDAVNSLYADDIVSVEAVDYQGLGRRMVPGSTTTKSTAPP